MKMLMTNEQIGELITRESFAYQNGHYKLTCQCENTIYLLSRYSRAKIHYLSKFRRSGGESLVGGGRLPPAPPLATALVDPYVLVIIFQSSIDFVVYDVCDAPLSANGRALHRNTELKASAELIRIFCCFCIYYRLVTHNRRHSAAFERRSYLNNSMDQREKLGRLKIKPIKERA